MPAGINTGVAGRIETQRNGVTKVTFTKPECIYCAGGLTGEDRGLCFNPYCDLVVLVSTGPKLATISLTCSQEGDAPRIQVLQSLIELALYEIAEDELDEELAARSPEQVAADEAAEVEHGVGHQACESDGEGYFYTDKKAVSQILQVLERFQIDHLKDVKI